MGGGGKMEAIGENLEEIFGKNLRKLGEVFKTWDFWRIHRGNKEN